MRQLLKPVFLLPVYCAAVGTVQAAEEEGLILSGPEKADFVRTVDLPRDNRPVRLEIGLELSAPEISGVGETYALSPGSGASITNGDSYAVDGGDGNGYLFHVHYYMDPQSFVGVNYFSVSGTDSSDISDTSANLWGVLVHPDNAADIGDNNVTYADADTETDLSSFSIYIGHNYALREHLALSVHTGLLSLSYESQLEANYGDASTLSASTNRVLIERESEFSGFGIEFGVDSVYQINESFSVFSGFSLGVLTGEASFSGYEEDADDNVVNVDVKYKKDVVVPTLSLDLGVAYKWMLDNGHRVHCSLAYSYKAYIGMHRTVYYGDDVLEGSSSGSTEDVGLSGMTLSALYQF